MSSQAALSPWPRWEWPWRSRTMGLRQRRRCIFNQLKLMLQVISGKDFSKNEIWAVCMSLATVFLFQLIIIIVLSIFPSDCPNATSWQVRIQLLQKTISGKGGVNKSCTLQPQISPRNPTCLRLRLSCETAEQSRVPIQNSEFLNHNSEYA